jgi:hypothetical protein
MGCCAFDDWDHVLAPIDTFWKKSIQSFPKFTKVEKNEKKTSFQRPRDHVFSKYQQSMQEILVFFDHFSEVRRKESVILSNRK